MSPITILINTLCLLCASSNALASTHPIALNTALISDNETIESNTDESEASIDECLNAMEKDGNFEVKPVSPFMVFLRGIGCKLLISYIAVKETIQCWATYLCHRSKISPEAIATENNSIDNVYEAEE